MPTLTKEQLAELEELYEATSVDWIVPLDDLSPADEAFAAAIHESFPALLEALAEKEAVISRLLGRATDAEAQAFSRGVELAALCAELQQANERVAALETALRNVAPFQTRGRNCWCAIRIDEHGDKRLNDDHDDDCKQAQKLLEPKHE